MEAASWLNGGRGRAAESNGGKCVVDRQIVYGGGHVINCTEAGRGPPELFLAPPQKPTRWLLVKSRH